MTRKTIQSGPAEPLTDAELRRLDLALSGRGGGQVLAQLGTHRVARRLIADLTAARTSLAAAREVHTRTEIEVLASPNCGEDGDCDHGTPGHADDCPTKPFGVCSHELGVLVEKWGEEDALSGRIPDTIDWPCATIKALDGVHS